GDAVAGAAATVQGARQLAGRRAAPLEQEAVVAGTADEVLDVGEAVGQDAVDGAGVAAGDVEGVAGVVAGDGVGVGATVDGAGAGAAEAEAEAVIAGP